MQWFVASNGSLFSTGALMDELERMRAELSSYYWDYRRLLPTVDTVLRQLYGGWSQLDPYTHSQVDRLRRVAAGEVSVRSISARARSTILAGFLDDLADIDPVLPIVFATMRNGKTNQDYWSEEGISYLQVLDLQRMMQDDPSNYVSRSAKGLAPPAARGQSTAPDEATVQFFTYVDLPHMIPKRTDVKHPFVVQLILDRPLTTRAESEVDVTFEEDVELVDVVVHAPGFVEASGYGPGSLDGLAWRRTIAVHQTQNSQPAVFLLQLADDRSGPRWVTVDFYHRGRNVGSLTLEVTVSAFRYIRTRSKRTDTTTDIDTRSITLGTAAVVRALDGIVIPQGEAGRPADVELRVIRDADGRTLHFHLHSHKLPGLHDRALGSVVFNDLSRPSAFFERLVERLSMFAARANQEMNTVEAKRLEDEIADIGIELYEQLFPEPLRQVYWELKALRDAGQLQNLLIVSDEPWIPWELVKPYDVVDGADVEDDHLAGAWQMSRWLAGVALPSGLDIRAAQLIAPILDLDFVWEEIQYFDSLGDREIEVATPITTRAEFLALAQEGGAQLFHFATHGNFNQAFVDESPITLQDEPLFPSDLNKRRAGGLRREKPLFFLNTCHGARVGFNLTGLGGWAQRLVDQLGVTAFVGTLWEVHDELASKFAQTFYEGLWDGKTLGESFFCARLSIRNIQNANPTWIAYTLYGDPNSRVVWKPTDGAAVE